MKFKIVEEYQLNEADDKLIQQGVDMIVKGMDKGSNREKLRADTRNIAKQIYTAYRNPNTQDSSHKTTQSDEKTSTIENSEGVTSDFLSPIANQQDKAYIISTDKEFDDIANRLNTVYNQGDFSVKHIPGYEHKKLYQAVEEGVNAKYSTIYICISMKYLTPATEDNPNYKYVTKAPHIIYILPNDFRDPQNYQWPVKGKDTKYMTIKGAISVMSTKGMESVKSRPQLQQAGIDWWIKEHTVSIDEIIDDSKGTIKQIKVVDYPFPANMDPDGKAWDNYKNKINPDQGKYYPWGVAYSKDSQGNTITVPARQPKSKQL